MIQKVISHVRRLFLTSSMKCKRVWKQFRMWKPVYQILTGIIILAFLVGVLTMLRSDTAGLDVAQSKTVTLASVASLSGNESSVSIIGTVRSITEANVLAQAGGTVQRLHTSLNGKVPAGFIILELDNASERASVLQAEGVYDAAVAARDTSGALSGEAKTAALTAYRSAYTTLDGTITTDIDAFFGENTPTGPRLLINPGNTDDLSRRRASMTLLMKTWQSELQASQNQDPEVLLNKATTNVQTVYTFLVDLAYVANRTNSQATTAQLASLATARGTVDGLLASLSSAKDSYTTKKTGSESGATAGAQAQVKQALGSLRGAQANLEKKLVRAPISGTVNFLPVRVGEYVTTLMHVATVAQNGALEIVAYVGETDRSNVTPGMKVRVLDKYDGVVTSVGEALDPLTKQIEVHIAVDSASGLVNGQSVRISLPNSIQAGTTTATGPLLLPLSAVKLRADERIVFTVVEGRLVATPVTIGEVRGETIEITSTLSPDLQIVVDARGLAEGEKVQITNVMQGTL